MDRFFEAHKETLEAALNALLARGYWSAYPEIPSGKIYGEDAKSRATAAFEAQLDQPFALDQPGSDKRCGGEVSPYGFALGISYPSAAAAELIGAAKKAGRVWARADLETRSGVCLEILSRLNKMSFEIAHAVMHTSGQAFAMAFQAGGPHAQDRGLEAVAYAYQELARIPGQVMWEKPQGRQDPIRLNKRFRAIPRGVALVIGCSTFPTWNSYPGLFASLMTGNSVIVKPHPGAILPLALTVRVCREVLAEAGQDPDCVLLAADEADQAITKGLVLDPDIAIVDYTGGPDFGAWVEANARQAQVFTEKAGVNSVVIDSCDNFKGMCQNLAFSLSLYSGQMCTAPQNIYVPRGGIETDEGHKTFEEVGAGLANAITKLLGDPERAAAILGAVQSQATLDRVRAAAGEGETFLAPQFPKHPDFADARMATPLLLKADVSEGARYLSEKFGPIAYVIATDDSHQSIASAAASARQMGAITAALYSGDAALCAEAEDAFADAGVALSENLLGTIYVNQSAAFSDYHVTGANPAGNACLTDSAFVASRFRVATVRSLAA